MFKLLSRMTDLEFDCEGSVCSAEVQQWSQGCYTLLGSPDSKEPIGDVLDVYLHFNSDTLPDEDDVGGDICYLAHKIGKKKSKEVSSLATIFLSGISIETQKVNFSPFGDPNKLHYFFHAPFNNLYFVSASEAESRGQFNELGVRSERSGQNSEISQQPIQVCLPHHSTVLLHHEA
jgi:Oxoglutarate and iron-dependent oxygenase degradation C-term